MSRKTILEKIINSIYINLVTIRKDNAHNLNIFRNLLFLYSLYIKL